MKYLKRKQMLHIEFVDGEMFYYVFTNKDHNLILVTRDGMLATQVNAALKNKKDDSYFRLLPFYERKKRHW